MEKLRIDKYLWAIRIFKTRGKAKDACDGGKVKLHGRPVKPAHPVAVGDEYQVSAPARPWLIRVTAPAHTRMAYDIAIRCYEDLTPEEDLKQKKERHHESFYTGKRLSKTGKPTKKQRRDLDRFRD